MTKAKDVLTPAERTSFPQQKGREEHIPRRTGTKDKQGECFMDVLLKVAERTEKK